MSPQFSFEAQPNQFTMRFSGRLDAAAVAALWDRAGQVLGRQETSSVRMNLEGVDYMDMAGATFISRLIRQAELRVSGGTVNVSGLKSEFKSLLDMAAGAPDHGQSPVERISAVERTGQRTARRLEDMASFITFVGEITWALASSLTRPGKIRWRDTWLVAERSGVDALPIVALISFIVGLVMAFQAAIPMKMFGAEIYVANLIGIAMVRELAPLMTAIVLAGRSASAFAAEIGTMKINEEIDALTVMGLEPVKFLIVPRIIAATLITPLLTVFSNLVGILGGALVILSFGYPLITYYNQVVSFVTWQDFTGGMVKCFVFGLLIAATGCIRGYQTLRGPSAVGDSTTSAVVTSIILIAVFDGIFSIVYYYLGV